LNNVVINDEEHEKGEFIAFDKAEGTIEIRNDSKEAIDIILFGGEKYREPIVFGGPFVMNSLDEISQAYGDFYEGKYGKINYSKN
jgi:redox-sensitive bicupin YhaK (pirin superfamily)